MADAVKIAPHVYKAILENDRVRVLEVRMRPGDKTEMHSHPAMAAYFLSDGHYRFTFPDGQTFEAAGKPGQAMFLDAVEHSTENIGATEGRVILVELK